MVAAVIACSFVDVVLHIIPFFDIAALERFSAFALFSLLGFPISTDAPAALIHGIISGKVLPGMNASETTINAKTADGCENCGELRLLREIGRGA